MADEVREYVRAAQAAEIRGDRAEAAELLWKAAQLYRAAGKLSRALTMLRHARRLDGRRKDVEEEIRRLEWLPEQPMRAALAADEALEEAVRRVLEPLENADQPSAARSWTLESPELPGDARKRMVERGPTLADSSLGAWCSFCCKPTREVGPLVAGPAGAFVCRSCVAESARLLGAPAPEAATPRADSPPVTASAPAESRLPLAELPRGTVARVLSFARGTEATEVDSAQAAASSNSASTSDPAAPRELSNSASAANEPRKIVALAHQASAKREIDQAIAWGRRRILLVGPAGAGKSTLLHALAGEHRGMVLSGASVPRSVPADWLLLIDESASAGDGGWKPIAQLWERHGGMAVLAVRGRVAQPAAFLLAEGARVALPTSRALVEATNGALPLEIAERVDGVVSMDGGDSGSHLALATALLRARGFAQEFIDAVVPVAIRAAQETDRGAHEIVAMVNRIPPGAWRLEEAAAPAMPSGRRGRGRKGQE